MALEKNNLIVPPEAEGARLDVFIASQVSTDTSRHAIQQAIKRGEIKVEQKNITKPGSIIHAGQKITFSSSAFTKKASAPKVIPDDTIKLDILYEEPSLLVLNKEAGIAVHSGLQNEHPTIADALAARFPGLKNIGEDPLRPGIVHRLDKDTSGVLLVARQQEAFFHFKEMFKKQRAKKEYLALVKGVPKREKGKIALPLIRSPRNPLRRTIAKKGDEGRSAETEYSVSEKFAHHSLLKVYPLTGRTHQIRVHLTHLGHPIVGDRLYGKQAREAHTPPAGRQMLHAHSLTISMPSGKKKTFTAPLPSDFQNALDYLKEHDQPKGTKSKNTRFRVPSSQRPRGE